MNYFNIFNTFLTLIPLKVRLVLKKIPILKQVQFFITKSVLSNKEFCVTISAGPAMGLVIPIVLPQDKQIWLGTWESDFSKTLSEMVFKDSVCYDIGGYKGYYSGIMAIRGAKKVFSFEPNPDNAKKIERLLTYNPDLPIELKQIAISDEKGLSSFSLMPEETMGKLFKSDFQKENLSIGKFDVETITLDSFVSDGAPLPDLIKIDVEGAEEYVLKGAKELISNARPTLLIEIHSREIGSRCYSILSKYYKNIFVLETGSNPNGEEPEICHYIATREN